MNKAEIRAEMRRLRARLPEEQQRAASYAIAGQLKTFAPYKEAETVMAYVAVRGELSLEPVIDELLASGKRLILPRCESPGEMTARLVAGKDQLQKGAYGIMEPAGSCPVVGPQEIDLILVPGTAFDRSANRLGQGGGYYDRFLPKTRAVRIGVCHDFALFDRLPAQEHDERMDAVLTPGGLHAPQDHEE